MKKLLSIIFILFLMASQLITANAEELNSDSITFFESMENLQKLKSYNSTQTISGNFKFIPISDNDIEEMNGQFTIKAQSDMYNRDAYENNMSSKISGRVNINIKGDKKPFEDLFLYFNIEMISILEDGIYVRLNQAYLKASGVSDSELQGYQEFKKEMDQYVSGIRGQWFYFPENIVGQEINENMPPGFEEQMELQKKLREQLKSDGIVKTYKNLINEMLVNEMSLARYGISEEESEQIKTIIDRFAATDFFREKIITAEGYYKDSILFVLDKRRIVSFIQLAFRDFGETLNLTNLNEFKEFLSKFYLSGAYHVDDTHPVYDKFRLKFILHDLDELKMLKLISFSKISDINAIGAIKGPNEFTNAEELDLLSFSQPNNNTFTAEPIPPAPTPAYDRVEVSVDDDGMTGSIDAPVTIVEFVDFQCPFCARFHNNTFPQIDSEYIETGKVRFVVRDFPLTFHANARSAALAAECLREQKGDNLYFDYIDTLYKNQNNLSNENLKLLAGELSVNSSQFSECLETEKYGEEINKDFADGQSYNVSGVPAFFINGRLVSGAQPFSAFKTVIDEELNL